MDINRREFLRCHSITVGSVALSALEPLSNKVGSSCSHQLSSTVSNHNVRIIHPGVLRSNDEQKFLLSCGVASIFGVKLANDSSSSTLSWHN